MRKLRNLVVSFAVLAAFLLLIESPILALDRQPNADYHARREALAKKVGGVVVLFAPMESEGPNDLYGFRLEGSPLIT